MRDSDPTVRFTHLGIAPRDAKGLVRTLRQDVARMSDDLLPDVAYSAAPGPLLGGWRVISEVVTEAVHGNMKGPLDLPVTKEQARFAAVPVIAFDPVVDEWIQHADRCRLGIAMGTRPNPDFGLVRYRETSQQDNALDPRLAARMSSTFYQAIATGIPAASTSSARASARPRLRDEAGVRSRGSRLAVARDHLVATPTGSRRADVLAAGADQRWSASTTVWAKPRGSSCGTL
jgi:hypothetical protein